MRKFLKDKKNIVIVLLSALSLMMAVQEGLRFLFWVLGGLVSASLADYYINKVFSRRRVSVKSALITGFIVSGVLDYHQAFYILVIFSLLAIVSKHLLRFRKKHLFNPANFALFLAVLFRLPLTWHIEANIFLIIVVGIYLAYVFKKIPHILGFLVFFLSLFVLERVNPFSILSFFFLFIMLIEPKTSGFGALRGFIFGSLAGIFSFLIFKLFPGYDFFIGSLFLANCFNPILDRIKLNRR
ncbi:MAG: hypothetical protein K9L86_04300 [Candidatus Omnitrophica bacterium]|nr:hypothetical protein [Candidatus Omnitrophota bacterium]